MPTYEQSVALHGGVKTWNQWREENPEIMPDFYRISLSKRDLRGINLSGVNLSMSHFYKSDLSDADLSGANLSGAQLYSTSLSRANLIGTQFISTALGTDFTGSFMANTVFADCRLGSGMGLEQVLHLGPSSIGLDVLTASEGNIPEVFLRGAGVPDTYIELASSLAAKSVEYYTTFISYSPKDEDFAKRLNDDLQSKGVPGWLRPMDILSDRKLQFPLKVMRYPYKLASLGPVMHPPYKFVPIVSADSLSRGWVRNLQELSWDIEKRTRGLIVLFPITLDDAVMDSSDKWAVEMRRNRHILDFRDWKNHDSYQKAFDQLLQDLKSANA